MSISFPGIPRLAKAILPRVRRIAGATMVKAAAVIGGAHFLTGCAVSLHPCSEMATLIPHNAVLEQEEVPGDTKVGTVIYIRQ